jgi:outer membrane lipoprotein SlyB
MNNPAETVVLLCASFHLMNPRLLGLVVLAGCLMAGCTMPSRGKMVSRRQVGQLQRIEYGTVQRVNDVVVEGQRGQIGLYGGGLVGAAAGGGIGHGVGRDLARAGGAVVGAVTGQAVEEAMTRKSASEFVIRLENGATVLVTEIDGPVVAVGDRVGVASGPGGSRILMP